MEKWRNFGVRAGAGCPLKIFYVIPRFCDSPTSDIESRTPKGRGKRGRATTAATTTVPTPDLTVAETRGKLRNANNKGRRGGTSTPTFNPPPSPVKSETGNNNKRKGREAESPAPDPKNAKRSRSSSRGANGSNSSSPVPEQQVSQTPSAQASTPTPTPTPPTTTTTAAASSSATTTTTTTTTPQQITTTRPPSPQLIECPEPNCNKKYTRLNGLKYHQSHAHNNGSLDEEISNGENRTESEVEDARQPSPTPVAETPADVSSQDLVKPSVLRFSGAPPQSPGSESSPNNSNNNSSSNNNNNSNNNNSSTSSSSSNNNNNNNNNNSKSNNEEVSKSSTLHTPTPSTQPSVIQPRLQTQTQQPVYVYPSGTTPVPPTSPQRHPVSSANVQVPVNPNSIPQARPPSQPSRQEVKPDVMRMASGSTVVPNTAVSRPNTNGNHQNLPSNPSPVAGVPSPRLVTPVAPQGTPLSSLPGTTLSTLKVKTGLETDSKLLNKNKEPVNGLVVNKEEEQPPPQPPREEARSPAYSDISDANDAAPTLDDADGKDFKDDKKAELALGAAQYAPYGVYYGAYGQHPSPYLMSAIPPPGPQGLPMKEVDLKDKSDKDKKDGIPVPGSNEYLAKYPQQYIYPYNINFPGYSDPYLRETFYKEALDKAKAEGKDIPGLVGREGDKGPTDLSRTSTSSQGYSLPQNGKDKALLNIKEKSENHSLIKDPHDLKNQLPSDKRYDPNLYRYPNHFDGRLPLPGSPSDKSHDKSVMGIPKPSPPAPLSSPRMGSTTPTSAMKDEKSDKKSDSKCEGVKPTMETTGPPPPPTSSAYYPPAFPYGAPFDPYRQISVPGMSLAPGFPPGPYLPGHPGPPPPGLAAGLRYPVGIPNGPEDLSRGGAAGGMFHSAHLYSSHHKIAELQERALKSPVTSSHSGVTSSGQSSLLTPPNKVGSPLTMNLKDAGQPVGLAVSSAATFNPTSPFNSGSSALLQSPVSQCTPLGPGGERKSPPTGTRHPAHPSLPEGYPYSLLPTQFSPHYAGKNFIL